MLLSALQQKGSGLFFTFMVILRNFSFILAAESLDRNLI